MNFYYENLAALQYKKIPMSIFENRNFTFPAHWHNDAELAYVKEGSICACVNNDKYILEEGDMLVLSSGDIHYYDSTDLNSCIYALVFNPECIGLSSNWPPKGEFPSPVVRRGEADRLGLTEMKNILEKIKCEQSAEKDEYSVFFIKACLNEICGLLLRNLGVTAKDKNDGKNITNLQMMQEVLVYIQDNFFTDISLQDIAKYCHVDLYHLSKSFNALTGTNLKTYINTLRVLKAENMIVNTDNSLTDIALESGFSSIRSFNRVFKALRGCTPSSIRNGKL